LIKLHLILAPTISLSKISQFHPSLLLLSLLTFNILATLVQSQASACRSSDTACFLRASSGPRRKRSSTASSSCPACSLRSTILPLLTPTMPLLRGSRVQITRIKEKDSYMASLRDSDPGEINVAIYICKNKATLVTSDSGKKSSAYTPSQNT
jgi:hypothetical protein